MAEILSAACGVARTQRRALATPQVANAAIIFWTWRARAPSNRMMVVCSAACGVGHVVSAVLFLLLLVRRRVGFPRLAPGRFLAPTVPPGSSDSFFLPVLRVS